MIQAIIVDDTYSSKNLFALHVLYKPQTLEINMPKKWYG